MNSQSMHVTEQSWLNTGHGWFSCELPAWSWLL